MFDLPETLKRNRRILIQFSRVAGYFWESGPLDNMWLKHPHIYQTALCFLLQAVRCNVNAGNSVVFHLYLPLIVNLWATFPTNLDIIAILVSLD